jgi:hypothetical protein
LTGPVFREANAKPKKGGKGKTNRKAEKRPKNKEKLTRNKARSGLFKEQAGITLRDNSHLLYEVSIFIIN